MNPRIKMLALSVALSGAAFLVSPLRAAQLPPRQELVDLLWHERFDELEKLTGEWREEKLGFYAGYSTLSRVYGYLDGPGRKAEDSVWKEYIIKLEKWVAPF